MYQHECEPNSNFQIYIGLLRLMTPTRTRPVHWFVMVTKNTRLIGRIMWDQISHEHSSSLILGFLVYEEHSYCIL